MSFKKYVIALAVLAALTAAIYGHTLRYPFQFDDYPAVVENPSITSLSNIPALFIGLGARTREYLETNAYRPFLFATYALDYAVAGLNPGQYRLTGIFLHAVNSFLVFLLIQSLLAPRGPDPWPWSLLAAVLFCVHPVQTEAVIYVAARSVLLVTALFLASVICYVRYRTGGRAGMLVAGVVFFALALLAKEPAVPLALVFVMLEVHLSRASGKGGKGFHWRGLLPFIAAASCYIAVRLHSLSHLSYSKPAGYPAHWMTEVSVLPMYLKLLILPSGLSVDHYVPDVNGFIEWRFIAGLAILMLGIILFFRYRAKAPLLSALIAWPFLALLPEMLVPLPDRMVEYRLYLPLAGILIFFAAVLQGRMARPVTKKAVYAAAALVCLTGVFGVASFDRGRVWASPETLWADAMQKEPLMARPYNNLGVCYYKRKDYARSLELIKEAVRLKPDYAEAYANLGNTYIVMGRLNEALDIYRKAFELDRLNVQAGNNLGVTCMMLGKYQEAYRTFALMSDAYPDNDEIVQSAAEMFEYYGQQGFADSLRRLYEERHHPNGPPPP